MSENELSVLPDLPLSKFDDKSFDKLAAGSMFLPRLMLYGSNSDLVKDEKVQIGYTVVEGKDTYTELGREIEVLCIAWRPKALDMSGDQIIANHDPQSEQFQRIANRADNEENSNCVYGPEFLIWLPQLSKFVTFLMGSKTARREASKVKPFLKKAMTLKTKLYSNQNFKWHGPEVLACSTPISPMPDTEALLEVANKFLNPPVSEVEEVQPDQAGSDRAR